MATKTKSEFKRLKRGDKLCRVKELPGGAEIRVDGGEFYAHDAKGRYLGWTNNQPEAEHMATTGHVNMMDDASDLSLWLVWNDALDSGENVLEDGEGNQFLSLGHGVVMIACEDKHGWSVELITNQELWDRYKDDEFDVLALQVADKPFRLE